MNIEDFKRTIQRIRFINIKDEHKVFELMVMPNFQVRCFCGNVPIEVEYSVSSWKPMPVIYENTDAAIARIETLYGEVVGSISSLEGYYFNIFYGIHKKEDDQYLFEEAHIRKSFQTFDEAFEYAFNYFVS